MKKLRALIAARNKEFYRDRSALAWTFIFPFLILAGFHFGYSGKQDPLLKIAVTQADLHVKGSVAQILETTPGVVLYAASDPAESLKKLAHYETDLTLDFRNQGRLITYSINRDSDKGKLAEILLLHALEKQPLPRPQFEAQTLTHNPIRYADWLLPGLLAMNIMFGSMFGVGYVIVRYRKNGVLKRLRATPLGAFQFLLAQVVSRMILMVSTAFIVILGAMLLFGFRPQMASVGADHPHWVSWSLTLALFLSVSAATMISLGLVVAARLTTEEVAEGVLNIMTWPMIFLSGIWFSVDGAASWVVRVAQFMPLTHVVSGLRRILIEGATIGQILPELVILLVLSLIFLGIGSALFRWR